MEVTSGAKECCVCGRQLSGSRWVRGSNQLRHSGRAVAEALGELLACEAQLSWVCFRCYRLVLGLDYHTHQQEKQKLALLRLYDSRDKTEQQASRERPLHDTGDGGGSAGKEVQDNLEISRDASPNKDHAESQKFDQCLSSHAICEVDKKILSYPLQSVGDHEYHRNDGQDTLSGKPATSLEGHDMSSSQTLADLYYTEKLVPVTLTPVTQELFCTWQVKLPSAAYLPRHLAALHQVKSHLTKGDILCELCGRGFSRKEALERHEARVHGKAHGTHQCSLCGHTFPHTSLLAEHLRAHQGYTCPECSKVFR
ncbi:Zinc finger and SCAN domain-containing protein 10 [Portunus trituberculatus]|uniref:Zinc finger and SCAN domain-containing protein 10 n=1 Tax=Portunus trituberculatus TaxID=210409 RepID=A0A5B7EJ51_PORTR|nr:Zinc finger and SCAN domain-containing protein 10 [Portunus trituberculatus]